MGTPKPVKKSIGTDRHWTNKGILNTGCIISARLICLSYNWFVHGLRTPSEEIAFTVWPKIKSQSQIYRYGRCIFYLPHWPNISDFFDFSLHWVSVVRGSIHLMSRVLCKYQEVLNLKFGLKSGRGKQDYIDYRTTVHEARPDIENSRQI